MSFLTLFSYKYPDDITNVDVVVYGITNVFQNVAAINFMANLSV